MIEQVITNFLTNAIKYHDPDRQCEITITSEKTDFGSRYSVKDNGIGISEENLDKVFHAFYRVDEETVEGDGVGLAIINRAIDLQGGKHSVESTLGEGSTFIFEIPDELLV